MFAARILVASDGSHTSMRALEYARGVIHGAGLDVAVIHVVTGETNHPESLDDPANTELPEARGQRILSEACHILGLEEEEVKLYLRSGHPAEQIVEAAREFQADMIIMGSRGRFGVKGSLGSVSEAVVADALCSVLVVKDQTRHTTGAG